MDVPEASGMIAGSPAVLADHPAKAAEHQAYFFTR